MQNLNQKLHFYAATFLQLNQFHCTAEVECIQDILAPDNEWITNTGRNVLILKKQCLVSPEKQAVQDIIAYQKRKDKLKNRKRLYNGQLVCAWSVS